MACFFWILVLTLFYIFAGYPLLLLLLSALTPRKPLPAPDHLPDVTLIVTAYNEEAVIKRKLENCLELDYPEEKLEIMVVSDGSNDRTDEIVGDFAGRGVTLLKTGGRIGKTAAQNEAARQARGEILVFSDANSIWEQDALKRLVAPFQDPRVGYACGRLEYTNTREGSSSFSEGLYWRYEIFLRRLESATGAITAGNGAIYAVRSTDYFNFKSNQSHDFEFPRHMVLKSKRAVYVHEAVAWEKAGVTTEDEFKRKVRMLARVWGSILKAPVLPGALLHNLSFTWKFITHRVLRYLAPFLLVLVFILNVFLYPQGRLYQILYLLQITFYSLALAGAVYRIKARVFYIPFYFCLFHYACIRGLLQALFKNPPAVWEKAGSTRT
ncbi:MAG TPA: glycosyltransferase family 2 protein [Bacillota bacterium]|nr:glycosyltransferase family 2 protein [Peptococcaceae bacterium MAG4]HPU35468.1 glycosyltransferase family 2 protein [Bacillota bacterium]HPZ43320.1 glycosyltransferase family 2 protein [Bacillota bacterium]HQD75938.1 glycosyltransferase family 2 protein [Bacillota bacterium]HUM58601.1 glycosyltransferase family 2 protein [Bacillota bacterium]